MSIMSGYKRKFDADYIKKLGRRLKELGAVKIVLGCTELSLLVKGEGFIDTLDILTNKIFEMVE